MLAIALLATVFSFTGCKKNTGTGTSTTSKPYIALVAKGFQFQYWQVVMQGAKKAATELGVTITFDGPPSESNIDQQVNMINADLAKHPVAICLAALDTSSVLSQLAQAKKDKIPVIGFDSGIPNAPAGEVAATAATDSIKAGAMAADKLFADTTFSGKLNASTSTNPIAIGVLSQDATSASIVQRTKGFLDEMKKNIEGITGFSGCVDISGQSTFNVASTNKAKVKIVVNVPPTTNATDGLNAAQTLLQTKNLMALYGSNQGAADDIDAATSDGADLDRTSGKYKDVAVVGFDAGKGQKTSVQNGWFLGSITQDPFQIGYDAVELAYKAYKGETVADMDTGAKWYDKTNMTNADIKDLLYD